MSDAILLKCRNCKRSIKYPRKADPLIPAHVVKIVQGRCDRCWRGDHDEETWYDKRGLEVSQSGYGQSS